MELSIQQVGTLQPLHRSGQEPWELELWLSPSLRLLMLPMELQVSRMSSRLAFWASRGSLHERPSAWSLQKTVASRHQLQGLRA